MRRLAAVSAHVVVFLVASCCAVSAQQKVSTLHVLLTTPIDLREAAAGQEISGKLSAQAVVGDVVLPKGAKVSGRIQNATRGAKDTGNSVEIVLDRVAVPDGKEVAVHAIIAAVAPAAER